MSGAFYTASEDSALLRKALRECSGESALEIGAGNAGNLVDLSDRFALVVGTDLHRPGMQDWREGRANFVLADRASCMRDSAFDLVAFNPPYLRGKIGDGSVDGGEGLEVPKSFMEESLRVVKGAGKVVFLLYQEADIADFEVICEARGFRIRELASERLFFEKLFVYVAERR